MYQGFFRSMSNAKSGNKEVKNVPPLSVAPKLLHREIQSAGGSSESNEIISLVDNLFQFRESMRKLTYLCVKLARTDKEKLAALKPVHECLSEVLFVIKKIIDRYPMVASAELYTAVSSVVRYIQGYKKSTFKLNEMGRLNNTLCFALCKKLREHSMDSSLMEPPIAMKQELLPIAKNAVFGVDLDLNGNSVPFIVLRCVEEIEKNGLCTKGIYRISAVKSKVDQLCEDFEKYGNDVKLDDVNPNIIANVLKLYFRQLPQPLFTFDLYQDFIRIGKTYAPELDDESKKRYISEVSSILKKLPKAHYITASVILNHLQLISKESEVNNMSAYNLAVIFGPTLLHCMKNSDDKIHAKVALNDNAHQIRAVELMINSADSLF